MKNRIVLFVLLAVVSLAPDRAWPGCLATDVDQTICVTNVAPTYTQASNGTPLISVRVTWMNMTLNRQGTQASYDFIQVRFSETQQPSKGNPNPSPSTANISQVNVKPSVTTWTSKPRPYNPPKAGPPYLIQVQGCNSGLLSPAFCLGWATYTFTPPPPPGWNPQVPTSVQQSQSMAPLPANCRAADNSGSLCITGIAPSFTVNGGNNRYVTLKVSWEKTSTDSNFDFLQVRFNDTENNGLLFVAQDNLKPTESTWTSPLRPFAPPLAGPPYEIELQGCKKVPLQPARCSGWADTMYPTPKEWAELDAAWSEPNGELRQGQQPRLPTPTASHSAINNVVSQGVRPNGVSLVPAAGTCRQGLVWRQAFPNDKVCVTPQERAQAATDNRASRQRTLPNGQCQRGFVWRQAGPQDHVCVTPQARAQAARQNRQAATRMQP